MKIFTTLMATWGFFCLTFVIMSAIRGGFSVSGKWDQWIMMDSIAIANVLFVAFAFLMFYKE